MRRTLALVATLALSGTALVAIATQAPAGATGSVNVSPSTNLTDGAVVTVSWTGLTPNGTPSIVQCKNAPSTGASGADCEFQTLQVASDGSNGSGAGSDTFIVHDTNGLAQINSHTEVKCDSSTSGSILVVDNPNDPSSGSYKTITCQGSATIVSPPHVLLSCTGLSQIATVSPALGSNSARYTKMGSKDSDGTKTEFGTSASIPADATSCAVDSGIRTDNVGTNVGTKLNPYDNQSGGQSPLTTTTATAKTSISVDGSATCQTVAQPSVLGAYPQAYPLHGKITMKFDQLVGGKQLQLQALVTLSKDTNDPDPSHYALTGVVAKGPGIGGTLSATVRLWPTTSTKNLNPDECTDSDVTDDALDASLSEMALTLADGADQNTTVDPLTVTIPA
ncbi:MAG: neocarzinostatin apoprotein domain-containing protein [Acidimicrobiia bacterium]